MTETLLLELEPMSHQFYRTVFTKYDKDQDGFISVKELSDLIEARKYTHDIPSLAVIRIHEMHDNDEDGKLNFQEFYALMTNPNMDYLFGHYVGKYLNFITPKKRRTGTTATDGEYQYQYSFYSQPVGVVVIYMIEKIFFTLLHESNKSGEKGEILYYFTFMFFHAGYIHMIVNLLNKNHLPRKMETMYRKAVACSIGYLIAIEAGAFGLAVVDLSVSLACTSREVYPLIIAHAASIIMNWKAMSFPAAQLLIFLIIAVSDLSTAIYNRHVLKIDEDMGHITLFACTVAGFLTGINLLRDLCGNRTETVTWWLSIITYSVLMLSSIIFNLSWRSYLPKEKYDDETACRLKL